MKCRHEVCRHLLAHLGVHLTATLRPPAALCAALRAGRIPFTDQLSRPRGRTEVDMSTDLCEPDKCSVRVNRAADLRRGWQASSILVTEQPYSRLKNVGKQGHFFLDGISFPCDNRDILPCERLTDRSPMSSSPAPLRLGPRRCRPRIGPDLRHTGSVLSPTGIPTEMPPVLGYRVR